MEEAFEEYNYDGGISSLSHLRQLCSALLTLTYIFRTAHVKPYHLIPNTIICNLHLFFVILHDD